MKNTTAFKILLTIATILLVTVIPIWVGPETMGNNKLCLLCEWFFGVLRLIGIAVVGYLIWYVFYGIYKMWDDIIE